MLNNKKQWTKPQLIILARGTSEESVLEHCKRIGDFNLAVAENVAQVGCDNGKLSNCGNCQSRSGS